MLKKIMCRPNLLTRSQSRDIINFPLRVLTSPNEFTPKSSFIFDQNYRKIVKKNIAHSEVGFTVFFFSIWF